MLILIVWHGSMFNDKLDQDKNFLLNSITANLCSALGKWQPNAQNSVWKGNDCQTNCVVLGKFQVPSHGKVLV